MKAKLLGFLFLLSCSAQRENKDVVQMRQQLPQIETPIEFNSDGKLKYKAIDMEGNELIKKLIDRNSFSLLGKIFETEDNITILGYAPGDIASPILITFDNQGNEINTHKMFESAKTDMGRYTSNIVVIQPDRMILFTDSTSVRKINTEGTDEIAGTDSVYVTHKRYRISNSGSIDSVE